MNQDTVKFGYHISESKENSSNIYFRIVTTVAAQPIVAEYGPYIKRHPTPAHLSVPLGQPVIMLVEAYGNVPLGQPVIMLVEAYGNPPPVYHWYRVHRGRGTTHPVENVRGPTLQVSVHI